jgi:hypothetical protein
MTVRAKFRVASLRQQFVGDHAPPQEVVELQAVTDELNKQWSQYTPQGRIEMHITNPEAAKRFPVGAYFYVDFTEAPAVDPKPAG